MIDLKQKDIFIVRADASYCDLSLEDRATLRDSLKTGADGKKGILVKFNLSSSARRINNRIYTPRGQRNALDSWTIPYKKPILLHHDKMKDPVGRVNSIEYIDNDQEAMKFFRSLKDFTAFKAAVESDKPKAIYDALWRNNLLTNPNWPGLGYLEATARVSDSDAIEKFLDERYLTFSAGTHTDRYVCGICNTDWAAGEPCDHVHGSITDDGKPVVFITGTFFGDEVSIVNQPANTPSVVRSIEFIDTSFTEKLDKVNFLTDESAVYSVDSIIEVPKMKLPVDNRLELYKAIQTNDFTFFNDAIEGKTLTEQKIIVSIHDGLHSHYDYDVKYSDAETLRLPKDVFALHGTLHDLAVSGGFRDALVNGELDAFSATGEKTGEYMYAGLDSAAETSIVDAAETQGTDVTGLLADLKASILTEVAALIAQAAVVDSIEETIDETVVVTDEVEAVADAEQEAVVCDSCTALRKDYEAALLQVDSLQKDLESSKNPVTSLDSADETVHHVDVDSSAASLPLPVVENPSISGHGSGIKSVKDGLGDYEKTIVQRYLDIQSRQGKEAADTYLYRKKAARHIPSNFNITNFIQESD